MNRKDSEDLVRVGPGTVMGNLMRQYWVPAAMSSELVTDGPPVRLMLLGERLIAFRDSAGRVGVMDHRCPHRCASLFLGRNEEGGLRCIYHGWKYDVDGNCLDTPNLPGQPEFKNRIKAKAYKTVERNGLVWVYMGERQEAPPLPLIEATLLPESEINIVFAQRECNWLQGLEGEIDTSHFGFLHAGAVDPADVPEDSLLRYTVGDRAPDYHIADTESGMMYGAYRPAGPGQTYWRFANFMLPFWTQTPQGKFTEHLHNRAWVPMDDHHTMFISLVWRRHPPPVGPRKNGGGLLPGFGRIWDHLPNTTDWFGRWRLKGRAGNDWLIDRELQKTGGNYSGIDGIHQQDQAITESMGPITDHLFEHMAPSDKMIMATRRRLLQVARAFAKNGTVPPGVDDPEIMYPVRSGDFVADAKLNWRQAYDREMQASVRPLKQAAE